MKLNKQQRAYLVSLGLATDATDEQVETFLTGLKPAQREILNFLAEPAAPPAGQTPTPPATPAAQPTQLTGGQTAPTPPALTDEQRRQIEAAALTADRTRREAIAALARDRQLPEAWAQGLCDRGVSLAQATELADLAATMALTRPPAGSRVESGEDRALAGLRPAIADALLQRAGVGLYEYDRAGRAVRESDGRPRARQPHERAAQFAGLSLARMAQEFVLLHGVDQARYMADRDILELAMTGRCDRGGQAVSLAMSTSDFPSLLGNVLRSSVRAFYADAEQTAIWPQWCARMALPDYRAMDLVSVSEVPDLMMRNEGGEVRFATFTDGHESVQVFMFSRGMRFTQQAQRNDQFGAFSRQIRMFAGAFVRLLDRGSTAILTVNAPLLDGVPLFNALHNNVPGVDGPITVATLSAARTALMTQRGMRAAEDGDAGPAILNIPLRTILTSAAQVDTARVLVASEYDPAVGVGVVNPVRNAGTVVGNPYLDAAGAATAWYAMGDPNGPGGGVVVALLEGEEVPEIRTQV
ncbi:MAG: hypothetical protein GX591_19055, partial [Planctomycetes bacterium]|nr:hypothetical protein [Planctomycetota bacterium]